MIVIAPVLAATTDAIAPKAGQDFEAIEWFDLRRPRSTCLLPVIVIRCAGWLSFWGPGGTEIELYRLL